MGEQDLEPTREMRDGAVYSGDDLTAYLNFGTGEEPSELRVGISPVNWQGAQKNFEAEAPSFDLAKVKEDAEYAWAE
ncbi:hypothetical protein OFN49_36640, partial [Escherichia coli]|nr:hypothetical protein [Escherichia coli]